ncbi:pentapeptide repeat-containing protein [Micromonospora sp. URMC 105]|uniref:pentapeptide repeat-containing protein n=1 Tax=Micromonospora sp. URMC 105 TaxID=3423413 RepID=UPI003F1DC963
MTNRLSVSLMAAGGLGLLSVALVRVPGSWWRVLFSGWPVLLPLAASLAVLLLGVLLWRRTTQDHEPSAAPTAPDRHVRPLRSWVIPIGVVLVAAVTWTAVVWLQDSVSMVGDGVQRAQLRVESIRTGLTIGAAVTGAFALLLAFRRQQLAERTQQATEYDAGEKRVTELYVKAADQLGSDKAPVRLAGLYALERLAQDNPVHRQSIVEVICAYLRMPYTPADPGTGRPHAGETSTSRDNEPADTTDTGEPDKPARDSREERQVRLAAQRILARHLRPDTQGGDGNPMYWGPKIVLDLSEATLIHPDFTGCRLHNATFTKAIFSGAAGFVEVWFSGAARFEEATFSGDATFTKAIFSGAAAFGGVTFNGAARFGGVTFSRGAAFDGVTFSGAARFEEATFSGAARFEEATFSRAAGFVGVTFSRGAAFDGVTFSRGAAFDGATFGHGAVGFARLTSSGGGEFAGRFSRGDAVFTGVTFSGGAAFVGVTFNGAAGFAGVAFSGDAGFGGVTFNGAARFDGATFSDIPWFDEVTFRGSRSFEGAMLNGTRYEGPPVAEQP